MTIEELESAQLHASYLQDVELIDEAAKLIADTTLPVELRLRALNAVDRVQGCADEPLREEDLERFLACWCPADYDQEPD